MKTFKDMTEKIRKGSEKDYIVIMTNKAGKEFKRLDYPTEKAAREAIQAGKFFGSADMSFKLENGGKSLKVSVDKNEDIQTIHHRSFRYSMGLLL